ncbi:unnamed protein product, partial [Urochloa humidicola]
APRRKGEVARRVRTRLPPAEDLRHHPLKTPSISRRRGPVPPAADKVHGVAAMRRVPGHGGTIRSVEEKFRSAAESSSPAFLWDSASSSISQCPCGH